MVLNFLTCTPCDVFDVTHLIFLMTSWRYSLLIERVILLSSGNMVPLTQFNLPAYKLRDKIVPVFVLSSLCGHIQLGIP